MNGSTVSYLYRLDASDRIVYVSPDWLRFAQENEAPELTETAVIGASLWDFVSGNETRVLYEALLDNLRTGRAEVQIPFRCDSPTVVRHMTLTLRSAPCRSIECEGRLDRAEYRPSVELLSRTAARSGESIDVCGMCRRLMVHGAWVETREAIVQMRLFTEPPVPALKETVCPDCRMLFP
jgi:hypothetical protein